MKAVAGVELGLRAMRAAARREMRGAGQLRYSIAVAELLDAGALTLLTLRAAGSVARRDPCRARRWTGPRGGIDVAQVAVVGRLASGRAVEVPLEVALPAWAPGVAEIRLQGEG